MVPVLSTIPNVPIFLIAFGIILLVYWVHAFFILYHLIRFGIGTKPKQLALIFFIGSFVLFFVTIIVYSSVTIPSLSDLTNFTTPL